MLYGPDLSYVHHSGFGAFAEEAAPGLVSLLRASGIHHGLIVDLACGSGIWPAAALAAGFGVVGIDVSAAMTAIARSVAPGGRFIVASAYDVPLPHCAAVTAIGEGLSYLPGPDTVADVETLLRRVRTALDPGGVFIFDVVEASVQRPMDYEAAREGPDWQMRVHVLEEPSKRLLTRTITLLRDSGSGVTTSREQHRLRTFDRAELLRLLRHTGFSADLIASYGTRMLPPHRIAFVARKE